MNIFLKIVGNSRLSLEYVNVLDMCGNVLVMRRAAVVAPVKNARNFPYVL